MDPTRALELAIEAHLFVDSLQVLDDEDRVVGWLKSTNVDERVDSSLYHGTAGIIVFLIELSRSTSDDRYLRVAESTGRMLADRLRAKDWASVAFATGWPGYSFAMQTLFEATGDPEFQRVSALCLERLVAQSETIGAGMAWIEPMPFSDITGKTGDREIYDLSVGAAGAALMFLHAHRNGGHPEALGWAVSVGDRLLEVAEETPDGRRWGLMADMPFPFTAPNFAHGGAGVGYFFAQLYSATGDQRHLDAAISAGEYVMSRSFACGGPGEAASLVCHTEEQKPPMFYLGECHGPAGTWRLLATLARLTGDDRWAQSARLLLDGLLAIGAPENRSDGWWANHGQCCGDAGLGDSALAMWKATGDADYLSLAHRCAAVIEERSTLVDGKRSWVQAEHRARPKFLQSQTGFMQGASGIGSFLLHLATCESAPEVRVWFPDEHL